MIWNFPNDSSVLKGDLNGFLLLLILSFVVDCRNSTNPSSPCVHDLAVWLSRRTLFLYPRGLLTWFDQKNATEVMLCHFHAQASKIFASGFSSPWNFANLPQEQAKDSLLDHERHLAPLPQPTTSQTPGAELPDCKLTRHMNEWTQSRPEEPLSWAQPK